MLKMARRRKRYTGIKGSLYVLKFDRFVTEVPLITTPIN